MNDSIKASKEWTVPELIEFIKMRCVGINQTADALRWEIINSVRNTHETPRSQEEDPADTARLDFIEGDCVELRCKEVSNGDDADTYFEAVKFYMAVPKERVVGFGSTARDAIDKAMANEDDKCAYCEGSGCTLCKPLLQQETGVIDNG